MHWGVLLAGGSGTRFWPLSSPRSPKQLLPLAGTRAPAGSSRTVPRLRASRTSPVSAPANGRSRYSASYS